MMAVWMNENVILESKEQPFLYTPLQFTLNDAISRINSKKTLSTGRFVCRAVHHRKLRVGIWRFETRARF